MPEPGGAERIYAPAGCDAAVAASPPWVGYEESMAALPHARWLAARLVHPDQRHMARVAAVLEWLDRTLAEAGVT